LSKKIKKIGILGGTFDPCHIGHLNISKASKQKFKLNKIVWAITKKDPFKKRSKLSLEDRIKTQKNLLKNISLLKSLILKK